MFYVAGRNGQVQNLHFKTLTNDKQLGRNDLLPALPNVLGSGHKMYNAH